MRLKVPPGSWLSSLLSSFGIVYSREYAPELAETVQPVYQINPGDIINNVTQYADDWTTQNKAFTHGSVVGPVAAQVSFGQCFNPVGSGVIAFVDRVRISGTSVNDRYAIRQHNAAIGALVGAVNSVNRYIGQAPGGVQYRQGTAAAPGGSDILQVACLVNTLTEFLFDPPMRLNEGQGVHVQAITVNTGVCYAFDWREVAP